MSNSILTYQVLLDIFNMLKEIQNDPKALDKAAKESYALGVTEQKRAEQSRNDIKINQELLKKIKDEQEVLKKQNEDFEKKKQEIDAYKSSVEADIKTLRGKFESDKGAHTANVLELNKKSAFLDDSKRRLDEQIKSHEVSIRSFSDKEKELELREKELFMNKEDIARKWSEIQNYEKNLREKAARLREQTEGL